MALQLRLPLWGAALAIEYCGPAAQFRVPFYGRSHTTDYAVSGSHMAERCALLIIVALGEGILVTGATFAGLEWSRVNVAAALVAFFGSVAVWWVYFDIGMRRGSKRIEHEEDSGRIARDSYTYGHIPIVAGIVVAAVGDEMLMSHAMGHSTTAFLLAMLGGNALFLAGTMVFKRMTGGARFWPLSHLVGLSLFALASLLAFTMHPWPIAVGSAVVAILALVAVWEWVSFHGGWVERGVGVPRFIQRYVDWRRAGS